MVVANTVCCAFYYVSISFAIRTKSRSVDPYCLCHPYTISLFPQNVPLHLGLQNATIPKMDNLKINDTVHFELYDCIGLVLKVENGKSFNQQNKSILTFDPESKTIGSRKTVMTSESYSTDPVIYQMLIGNKKAWISSIEVALAIDGCVLR